MTSSGMPFLGNGKILRRQAKAYTYVNPRDWTLDSKTLHQRGVDIYPGDFRNEPAQTWDDWFAKDMRGGGRHLSRLARWAGPPRSRPRGQVLSRSASSASWIVPTPTSSGMFDRLTVLSKTQPVGYVMYFHQADSKIVGRPGQEANVASVQGNVWVARLTVTRPGSMTITQRVGGDVGMLAETGGFTVTGTADVPSAALTRSPPRSGRSAPRW
jgi:hypothetical protein